MKRLVWVVGTAKAEAKLANVSNHQNEDIMLWAVFVGVNVTHLYIYTWVSLAFKNRKGCLLFSKYSANWLKTKTISYYFKSRHNMQRIKTIFHKLFITLFYKNNPYFDQSTLQKKCFTNMLFKIFSNYHRQQIIKNVPQTPTKLTKLTTSIFKWYYQSCKKNKTSQLVSQTLGQTSTTRKVYVVIMSLLRLWWKVCTNKVVQKHVYC